MLKLSIPNRTVGGTGGNGKGGQDRVEGDVPVRREVAQDLHGGGTRRGRHRVGHGQQRGRRVARVVEADQARPRGDGGGALEPPPQPARTNARTPTSPRILIFRIAVPPVFAVSRFKIIFVSYFTLPGGKEFNFGAGYPPPPLSAGLL